VWFGVISYPLYLWHWPLLSFATIVEGEFPSRDVRAAAVVLSIVLASLTYTWIERPVRLGVRNQGTAWCLAALMGVVGCMGYCCYALDGLLAHAAAEPSIAYGGDVGYEKFHEYPYGSFPLCTPLDIQKNAPVWNGTVRCLQSKNNTLKKVAIIGDSHAEHLFAGLAEQLTNVNVVYYTQISLPVESNRAFDKILSNVIQDKNIDIVILSAYWNSGIKSLAKNTTLESELVPTVNALRAAGKTVYIADDVPNFLFSPKKCKYEANWIRTHKCVDDGEFLLQQYRLYFPILNAVKNETQAKILEMAKYFCIENICSMEINGTLLYRDNNHLNLNGSRYLAKLLLENNPDLGASR
jgi:hypothetical protein